MVKPPLLCCPQVIRNRKLWRDSCFHCLNGYETTISKILTTLTVQAASHQRTDTLERMRHQVILEMDKEITRQYWGTWFAVD